MGTSSRRNNQAGFTLMETMIAMAIFVSAMLSILLAFQMAMVTSLRSRGQITAGRLMNMVFTKFKSINYYSLFACNSSLSNYGLTGTFQGSSVYPYKSVLNLVQNAARVSGFSHFTVEIAYLRRDISDANGNGLTSDLIAFTDANGDKIDDYDPSIRYYDKNGDGDYKDTYSSSGRVISEEPDTHLKEVTVKLWKKGRVVAQQSELVSLEQFSGIESAASGAILRLFIAEPANNTYLYNLDTAARTTSFGLTLARSFPADIVPARADMGSPLYLTGETDPVAVVHFYVNNTATERDNTTADMSGIFTSYSTLSTLALVEGQNRIWAKATKDANLSPFTFRDVVLDLNPPSVTAIQPTGTVHDRAPRVGAVLSDTGISTDVVSGICPSVITLKKGTQIVAHEYHQDTGEVVWVDSSTLLPVTLTTGTYSMTLEGADNAHYKVRQSWNFTVAIDDPDNSAPAISNKSPIGSCDTALPEIQVRVFDNQSGIDPGRIALKFDGAVVVDASNIGAHYNASTGYITYTPATPLDNGSMHTLEVSASHWATTPADKVTSTDLWNFFVNMP
jgi:prepilin-type N-terminal cleavage/methylation domain-containing protein